MIRAGRGGERVAQAYSTGPAHVFVGIGPGNAPVYLGTSKDAPDLEHRPGFKSVKNDVAGGSDSPIDYDQMYLGTDALLSVVLTRFNFQVWLAMCDRALPLIAGGVPAGTPGADAALDRGTLLMTEGLLYPVWVRFPTNPAVAAYSTMVPGWRYAGCYMIGPDRIKPGIRPLEITAAWHALPVFNPSTGGALAFDNVMTGLPAIN